MNLENWCVNWFLHVSLRIGTDGCYDSTYYYLDIILGIILLLVNATHPRYIQTQEYGMQDLKMHNNQL